MVDFTPLATQIKTPEAPNLMQYLQMGMAMRQQAADAELNPLRRRQMEADIAQSEAGTVNARSAAELNRFNLTTAQGEHSDLEEYGETGDLNAIRSQPAQHSAAAQTAREQQQWALSQAAAAAQSVLAFPKGPERDRAWNAALDQGIRQRWLTEQDAEPLRGPANELVLQSVIDRALSAAEYAEVTAGRETNRQNRAAVDAIVAGPGGAAAPGGAPAAPGIIDQIGGVESSGNDTATNSRSSAYGRHQFLGTTWLDMVEKYAPEVWQSYGGASRAGKRDILALRADPELSSQMAAAYARENMDYLKRRGLPVTGGSIYLAHFLGPEGARKVLSADPSMPVSRILAGNVIWANREVLRGKTAGQVVGWAAAKMNGDEVYTDPSSMQLRGMGGDGYGGVSRQLTGGIPIVPDMAPASLEQALPYLQSLATKSVVFEGINPDFATEAARAFRDAEIATGVPVKVVSGVRTTAEQARLRAAYERGEGGLAARPGHSRHEKGEGMDLVDNEARVWLHTQIHDGRYPALETLTGKAYQQDRAHLQWSGKPATVGAGAAAAGGPAAPGVVAPVIAAPAMPGVGQGPLGLPNLNDPYFKSLQRGLASDNEGVRNLANETMERLYPNVSTKLQEYNAYVQQEIAAGRVPKPFDPFRPDTVIDMGGGKVPLPAPDKGRVWATDREGNLLRDDDGQPYQVRVRGSEADDAARADEAKGDRRADRTFNTNTRAMVALDDSLFLVERNADEFGSWQGLVSEYTPGSVRWDVQQKVNMLRGINTLDQLQALKELSNNGASGLGSATEGELKLLQDSVAALDASQSPEELVVNMRRLRNNLLDILFKDSVDADGNLPEGFPTRSPIPSRDRRTGRYPSRFWEAEEGYDGPKGTPGGPATDQPAQADLDDAPVGSVYTEPGQGGKIWEMTPQGWIVKGVTPSGR